MNDEYKELEKPFLDFATERGMVGIKGHRSVGGFPCQLLQCTDHGGCSGSRKGYAGFLKLNINLN